MERVLHLHNNPINIHLKLFGVLNCVGWPRCMAVHGTYMYSPHDMRGGSISRTNLGFQDTIKETDQQAFLGWSQFG